MALNGKERITNMKRMIPILMCAVLPLFGSDALKFEAGLPGWNIRLGKENIKVIRTPYGSGVEMRDSSRSDACNMESAFLPAKVGGYELTGRIRVERDEGITIKIIFYDKAYQQLDMAEIVWIRTPTGSQWADFTLTAGAAWPQTAFCKVFIYSWYETMPVFAVADLKLREFEVKPVAPRWVPTFRNRTEITPDEMLGPDGIVYPDFTYAGLKHPNTYKKTVAIEDFGGKAAAGFDNYPAIRSALQALAVSGGELRFGEGTYEFGHPVFVASDNIAIRGAGRSRTKLLFNFTPGPDGIRFCWLEPGQTVGPATSLIAVADASGMIGMDWRVDGKEVRRWNKNASSGNASSDFIRLDSKTAPGKHRVSACARYRDGRTRIAEIEINFDPDAENPDIPEKLEAVLLFSGKGFVREQIPLAKFDAKQGEHIIELEYSPKYRPGDLLKIEAPLTERWRNLVKSACRWGYFRDYLVEVKWVNARRVGFTQPLRIDYPLVDRPFVQKLEGIRNCEVSGFELEQTANLWLASVFFKYASNCKATDLFIRKSGRHPFFSYWSRNLELTDSEFDDVWDRGGGGAGYTSWELTFDSLMDRVVTHRMRHAPSFQWAAAGNVIRRSCFLDSDAHWHAGWTNNNLLEQCRIKSIRGYGSYGYGMWSSFPGDGGKGPNGPRNVIYNCDVVSPLGSVWLGGMNENWLILYNRFTSEKGPGVLLQNQAFEQIIRGNVFKILNPNSPMVLLRDPDCTGVEIVDNILIGGSSFWAGLIAPEVFSGNRKLPGETLMESVAPRVAVPSIYEWQLRKKGIAK